ncbi:MAG: DNA cytosine methyltransferase [Pseudomonadota bacterium]
MNPGSYRRSTQFGLSFDELLVDNFAGGGGASTGIEMAMGRPVDIAINHDTTAISMHTVNHPQTTHYLDDVWQVGPRKVVGGRPVGLAWFSPDCTHHSKARGGKPVSPRVRGLAWVVLKWAGLVRPRVIMLENVEEFEDWGPLTRTRKPCKRRRGMIFERFVSQLRDLGYAVEWQQLRACDYGAPTIRKRLFLIARRDGLPIVWPEPTHGPDREHPYRTAAEIIDWSIPCPSIFTRKRPLAENTMRRIAKGIQRFVIEAEQPFIINTRNGERPGQDPRIRSTLEPYWTVTAAGSQGAIVDATLAPFLTEHANASSQRVFNAQEPLRTQVAGIKGGHFSLCTAFLAKHFGGMVGVPVDTPLPTTTTKGCQTQLVTSNLVKLRNNQFGQPVTEPMPTITAGGGHVGEVRAFLLKYYGTNIGSPANEPLHSITARSRFGLVLIHGEPYQIIDIGMRMLKPHELYAAQGFPLDYIHDRTADGTPLTITEQVAKCGNSVCPPVVEALVRANVRDQVATRRIAA